MHLVTQDRLDQANYAVTCELDRHGFYDAHVRAVDTCLALCGSAYGWQCYGSTGEIHIPRVSLARLWHIWTGGYVLSRKIHMNTTEVTMKSTAQPSAMRAVYMLGSP